MRAGFEVRTASDGEEAIRAAREITPDLILLDWALPGTQSMVLLQQLKSIPATQSIPVIMLSSEAIMVSSNGKDEKVDSVFASGSTGFIPRNAISITQIVGELQKLMERLGSQPFVGAQPVNGANVMGKLPFRVR